MRVLYGTPLPPGLVAPTRGELRLRIDQLILDDEVINHSPLVQLFEAPDSASAVAATDVGGAETATASFSRSPNHFVVPVDYCSVGPIFWGETRPSAQGQPATPQLRRGPVTMVYPIKMAATQFGAYLERMTESPQQGVQLDVFVPSSYSGRPPVTVGRCRITLDTLQPGHPVKGWFPVMHRRARLSAAEADLSKYVELAVGKVKLTVTVEYYPSSRQPSAEPTAATKHKRHEGKDGGHVPLPRAKTRRSHRHPGRTGEDAAHPPTETSSTSTETAAAESPVSSLLSPAARETARRRGRHSGHVGHHGTALLRDKSAVTHQLLQQGLRLRAQMEAAARGLSLDNFDSSTDMTANRHRGVGHGHVSFEDVGTGALADDADEDISDGIGVVYTSADSDEEKFALQMQKDAEARDRRGIQQQQQSTVPSSSPAAPAAVGQHLVRSSAVGAASETAVEVLPIANDGSVHGTRAAVELCFSNFSFAQTSLTADLHKIRINVRLSSDITTLEPSSGPLSSFVHPVPVQQPFICLLFDVCSFFEDHSKLVVEAYKVMSELELDNENDGWDVQGPRHVAKEELLGLSVIGLYRQSRAVVFRDPVADTSNVFAQLDVRVRPHGVNHSTATSTVLDAPAQQQQHQHQASWNVVRGTINSSLRTPASDAVPPSSIAACASDTRPAKENAVSVSKHKSSTERGHVQDASAGEEASSIAGTYPPHVSHSPVGNSSSSTTRERRRLRVVVYSAAELPRVAVAQGRGHGAVTGSGVGHFPIISARPRSIPEAGVEGVTSYAEPNSFVTIEEVYRVAETWCTKSKTAAPTSRGASAPSSSRQSIHNWYVDEARGGFYDRSAVAKESSNPSYNYEVTLQLPEMTVPTGNGTAAAAVTHGLADVLDELQLAVWHSDLSRQTFAASGTIVMNGGAGSGHSRSRGTGVRQQEEHFWECAAYMGTCRVDLRPLRYLKTLDGYYRVVCERTPGSAVGPTSTDVESNTIGYVRLSVSLQ
ncbi:conserved hypothetical protein [Leishmania infantum JPCM5]|uniref:C2CD3 N-terminal C2 domain-containing protein n=2 Tax=Leishmania infantum TaxID=5671 RepID=A4I9V6_LEIIN|nr:conserved hypothetical protein [Leishmania infantum JPCM5]CAC9537945.1 hypothetical_protein_-_conserved [Leishmania infantum]CAM71609.1 conserved hypothetical protein [Leishmania infantum JPCM5]SUZ45523.1 hypothetical_protein_-_conserved [Leishmania infantum]|eukprot:XP_001468525.1 conserved hypothetical protein [Leishmania infantum JPCM5]